MPHQEGATSVGDLLRRTAEKFPERISHRYHVKKGFEQTTFAEFFELVFKYARALNSLGLKRGDHVVILGESCIEWALTDWACQTLGIVTIPIYPTLPSDQALHIYRDSDSVRAFVIDPRLGDKLPDVPVTYVRGHDQALLTKEPSSKLQREEWLNIMSAIHLDDLSTIIYTSGTTGVPKGATLVHRSFVDLVTGIGKTIPITHEDVFLSFLPLSHVYERFAGHVLPVAVGAKVVYTQSAATIASDLTSEGITIFPCVPRLLEAFRNRILDNALKASHIQQRLFKLALEQGTARYQGKPAPMFWLTDRLVGEKIRSKIGPTMRFFVSGGAGLPPHVSEFFMAFRVNILQGYGLTETCAASSLNHPDRNRPWTSGEPLHGVEMKIAPDGEILIRGTSVMKGYYKQPEATAEVIDQEGWFHTGDIGQFDGASIMITDRKKDILVLGNGKNVAPQRVEGVIKQSEWVGEAVVYGDGMEYCCALILPNVDRLRIQFGSRADDLEELLKDPEVVELYKKQMDLANNILADFERVKRFVVLPKQFTVEGGELTPSMKVRRKVVKAMYDTELKSMQRHHG